MQKIRKDPRKQENEFVNIEEFCHYTSLKYEQVMILIIDQKSIIRVQIMNFCNC